MLIRKWFSRPAVNSTLSVPVQPVEHKDSKIDTSDSDSDPIDSITVNDIQLSTAMFDKLFDLAK